MEVKMKKKWMNWRTTQWNFFARLLSQKNLVVWILWHLVLYMYNNFDVREIEILTWYAQCFLLQTQYRLWYGMIKQTFPCGKFDWSSKQWHPVLILPCNHLQLKQSFHQNWVWTKMRPQMTRERDNFEQKIILRSVCLFLREMRRRLC